MYIADFYVDRINKYKSEHNANVLYIPEEVESIRLDKITPGFLNGNLNIDTIDLSYSSFHFNQWYYNYDDEITRNEYFSYYVNVKNIIDNGFHFGDNVILDSNFKDPTICSLFSFSNTLEKFIINGVPIKYLTQNYFRNCINLKVVDFSNCNELQFISNYSFQGCENLINIDISGCTIKETFTDVNGNQIQVTDLFGGCSNLENIYVKDQESFNVIKKVWENNLGNSKKAEEIIKIKN